MTRIADYNWGAAFINPTNDIIVVVDQFKTMNKAEVVATAKANGLVITKTTKSIHQPGTKGHIYKTVEVA
jgi:hypothetical protein